MLKARVGCHRVWKGWQKALIGTKIQNIREKLSKNVFLVQACSKHEQIKTSRTAKWHIILQHFKRATVSSPQTAFQKQNIQSVSFKQTKDAFQTKQNNVTSQEKSSSNFMLHNKITQRLFFMKKAFLKFHFT